MRTGLTPQEVRGPQRTEPLTIGGGERNDNPMALLGLALSIVVLLMSPLTFSAHVALGFTLPLVPAAISYAGYRQATRQGRPYRRLALVGLIISLVIHIVIAAVAAFVIGVAIVAAVGFVIFLFGSDDNGGKRRRGNLYPHLQPRQRGRQW